MNNIDRARSRTTRPMHYWALSLLLLFVAACDDSNDRFLSHNVILPGCADTQSCVSNPPLELAADRPAQVQIPSDYNTATRYPLIVLLHGFGATGAIQAGYLGLPRRVDTQQFVLVVPDGTVGSQGERYWNASPAACCAFTEEDRAVDDLAYIRQLIEEAAATYSIDASRVGLFGHSNGGFMALKAACEASDIVTSVVSLAGSTFEDEAACAPATQPVSVLALHGDNDETIAYQGSTQEGFSYPAATETIRRFADKAGCDLANPLVGQNIDVDGSIDGLETNVLSYLNCAEGVDVELWTIVGGPHIPFPWIDSAIDSTVDWLIDHSRN